MAPESKAAPDFRSHPRADRHSRPASCCAWKRPLGQRRSFRCLRAFLGERGRILPPYPVDVRAIQQACAERLGRLAVEMRPANTLKSRTALKRLRGEITKKAKAPKRGPWL